MTEAEKQRILKACKEAQKIVDKMPKWKRDWIEYDMKYNAEKVRQYYKNLEDDIYR